MASVVRSRQRVGQFTKAVGDNRYSHEHLCVHVLLSNFATHFLSRFALDWLPAQRRVTVLYGDAMCTLYVSGDYSGREGVSLVSVAGEEDASKFMASTES